MARFADMQPRGSSALPRGLGTGASGSVIVSAGGPPPPPAPIQAGAARHVEIIEAQLRQLNDRGKAVYYDKCVGGLPDFDPAFPGAVRPPTTPGATGTNAFRESVLASANYGQGIELQFAIHRTQPPWTGLDQKYDDTISASGTGKLGFRAYLGMKFDDVTDATTLFLYDVYEECRLALAFLAANPPADHHQRPVYCSEIGRYGSCLYDAAARPTPAFYVDIQTPYSAPGTPTHFPPLVRADEMERALGRPLRDEDLLPGGAATTHFMAVAGATETNPWLWNDVGPATQTYHPPVVVADGYHHQLADIHYGGSAVLVLAPVVTGGVVIGFNPATTRLTRVVLFSGAEYVLRAQQLAAYLAPKNMSQFLMTQWAGYLTALKPFVDSGLLNMTAAQLQQKQDDATRAKAMGDAQAGVAVAGTAAGAVPVVGWIVSAGAAFLGWLLGWLPVASGVWPLCPPPFLMRYPSTSPDPKGNLQDVVAGNLETTTHSAVESVHHDVVPPSFSAISGYVQAKQSAAKSALIKKVAIGLGVATGLAGLVWVFKRSKS